MTYYLINNDIIFDNASGKIVHVIQRETQQLKSNEWKLLRLFVTNPGIDISADWILNAVWDGKRAKSSVATCIKNLRQLLGDSADTPRYIQTQAMKGYALIAEVTAIDEDKVKSALRRRRSLLAKGYSWCVKRPQSIALYALNLLCLVSLMASISALSSHGVFDDWMPERDVPEKWQPMVIKGSQGQESLNYITCNTLLSDARRSGELQQLNVSPFPPSKKLPALTWSDATKKVLLCHLSDIK